MCRNVRQAALLERGSAEHPRDVGRERDGQRDRRRPQARTEYGCRHHGQQDAGKREQDVQARGDHRVGDTAPPGRDEGQQRSACNAHADQGDRPQHRALRAGQQPGQHVPALKVIAE
jgi:hypothetical protein